jgi:CheY-like chemotaxis protein
MAITRKQVADLHLLAEIAAPPKVPLGLGYSPLAQATAPLLHWRRQEQPGRGIVLGEMDIATMIRLLLVDDQASVRRGLRMRLALESDFFITGEAEDGLSALALMHEHCPDVVLMDAQMPRMDGIITTVALRAAFPDAAVVILSLHDDEATRKQAIAAGAAAFLSKQAADTTLVDALRRAAVRRRAIP